MLPLTPEELLTTTRNVRKRLDFERPIDRELIVRCLDVALQAPTASNDQRWEWIAVDDPALRESLGEIYRGALDAYMKQGALDDYMEHVDVDAGERSITPRTRNTRVDHIGESVAYLIANIQRAPVILIPVAHAPGRLETSSNFEVASAFGSILPAVWSMMLALRAHGLGSCWTTLHLLLERETAELLGIDYEEYVQVGMFPVAYTIGTDFRRAQRAPARDVLHWQRLENADGRDNV